jgi:hypothetical protein
LGSLHSVAPLLYGGAGFEDLKEVKSAEPLGVEKPAITKISRLLKNVEMRKFNKNKIS